MTHYSLNLPTELKHEAEHWALLQGVSLNQFILWAVAEKVGSLKHQLDLDDPAFPQITYRRGANGHPVPTLRGTGIRVQTIIVAAQDWELSPAAIATEYGLSESQVNEALTFYQAHRQEIEIELNVEQSLEPAHG